MSNFDLTQYYEDCFHKQGEDLGIYEIFDTTNIKNKKNVCIKVLNFNNEEILDKEDLDIYKQQIESEAKILNEFNSKYTIKLNNKINLDKAIVLEIEEYEMNLNSYINDNSSFEEGDINIFKSITINMVRILKELKEKGIIHRNIKPQNIFKFKTNDNSEEDFNIKLGNFDCAIYKKDISNSTTMGTFMYLAPEINKNELYDEKSDLWSLGVTLFELYFGVLPFGQNASINKVKDIIYEREIFIYRKSKIPTLDVLFRKLLTINPEERMSLEELSKFVENENFLKENYIYKEYLELYKQIKEEEQIEYIKVSNEATEKPHEDKIKKIQELFETIDFEGINEINKENFEEKPKFNNIIYYDENDKLENVYKDCDNFEQNIPGAFIYCNNKKSLELVKMDILDKLKENKKYKFNLITTGKAWYKVISNILEKDTDYKKFINNVCIYCRDIKKYKDLSLKVDILQHLLLILLKNFHQVISFLFL